jgi:serine/threonine protein kinase
VFITYDGEVKLVDFGIAKVLSRQADHPDGMRKGKLAYMSPEQVRGGPIDRRSDVFALGILLYEMVTLTHLFDGDNEYAIMEKISEGEVPPPSTRRRGIAPELERIILKALALRRRGPPPDGAGAGRGPRALRPGNKVRVSMLGLKQFLTA